jgi:CheY-like chemotaxis protein
VDDTEADRYALTRYLENDGYRVCGAANAAEAIRLAKHECPDLILLDVALPDMSGYEACARLKADPDCGNIPVIHTSAADVTSESQLHGVDNGADAFLTMPADPAILLGTVKAWLRVRRSESERETQLKELRRTKALLQAVLDQMPVGVSAAGAPDGKALLSNQAVTRLLGHDIASRSHYQEYADYGAIHADGSKYAPKTIPRYVPS